MSALTAKSNFEDKSLILSDIKKRILKMQILHNVDSFFLGELPVSLPVKYSNGKAVYGKIADIYCDEHGILRADIVAYVTNKDRDKDSEIFWGCDIEELSFFDLQCISKVLSANRLSSFPT